MPVHIFSPIGRAMAAVLTASVTVVAVFSQSHSVSGPGMGLVFDPGTRSLRPMHGIPGSAFLGAPVSEALSYATVAPNGNSALGWGSGEPSVYGAGAGRLPENTLREVTCAAWQSDGSAVWLYAAGTRQLQRIANPLGSPAVEPAYALPLEGRLNFLAVHGGRVIAGVEQTAADGLYEIDGTGARLLAELTQPAAGTFSRDGGSFLAASRDGGRIVEYETGQFGVRSESPAGGGAVVALALSADARMVYVLRSGVLTVMERAGGRIAGELALEFDATGLGRLAAADVFSLAGGTQPGDPVWIFAGRTQSVYFVPGGLTANAPEVRQ